MSGGYMADEGYMVTSVQGISRASNEVNIQENNTMKPDEVDP
jgi:hypothetical protein